MSLPGIDGGGQMAVGSALMLPISHLVTIFLHFSFVYIADSIQHVPVPMDT